MPPEFEPLDESLNRKVQMQQLKVEEMTLKVAERRKRVPEQVKMLLDDAIRRQSAMADRVEFEADEDNQTEEDADMWEGMEISTFIDALSRKQRMQMENVYIQHGFLFNLDIRFITAFRSSYSGILIGHRTPQWAAKGILGNLRNVLVGMLPFKGSI